MSGNHGKTPAAWTAVIVIILGFLVGGVAVVLSQQWLFAVGVVVVVLGVVAGKVLSMMGYGAPPGYRDH